MSPKTTRVTLLPRGASRVRHIPVTGWDEKRKGYSCNLKQIAIRLSPPLFEKLKQEAIERQLSMSSVIVEKLGDPIS